VSLLSVRTIAAGVILGLAVGGGAVPALASAGENERRVQLGDPVDDVELKTLDGRKEHFLQKGVAANVFVFFRLEQERSLDTLKDMAACEKEFERKSVRWIGVVSDEWPADAVKAFVKDAGVRMPVLVDVGDALYGKLGIRLHPVIGMVDRGGKLAAFEPFRQINYCERVRVRVKLLLGEATAADVARVDEPERSTTRTEDGVARRHLNFARMLHTIKQHDKALAEVQQALASGPSAGAYALQGQILAALGKCPEALRAFDAALKIEPANAVAQEGKKSCGK
jgi:tetratricopeptide (TPR) repeat protein